MLAATHCFLGPRPAATRAFRTACPRPRPIPSTPTCWRSWKR